MQGLQPLHIVQARVKTQHLRGDGPEGVARMGVVTGLLERRHAGHGAQHQHPRIGRGDGGKAPNLIGALYRREGDAMFHGGRIRQTGAGLKKSDYS
ncbi:hypothetical protein D3C78_1493290 [compost metagenome]